jgi:murein DD-endopeptidase MepM/ murein hydrolase activator NlpD
MRPVDANANSEALFYYSYGSDGPQKDNPLRIHHGIDMPNPIGETVRAAGPGVVTFAADGVYDNSYSYGNVVEVKHDFGYKGQPLFTVYAHLSVALVKRGQYVRAGDVIGLVGETGNVTGPHVHFEIRMGKSTYGSSYNPLLWMVPWVGTGVIAGRIMDANGNLLQDQDVTIRKRSTGTQQDTTTTYIYDNNGSDVNADPIWQENFVVGDVPVGRYDVVVNIDGQRVSKIVDVLEGTTTFVELQPTTPATPQSLTPAPITLTPSS